MYRWFITLYNTLESPINNTALVPYNVGYSSSSDLVNNPLEYKGVFEVYGTKVYSGTKTSIYLGKPFFSNQIIGNGGLGFLLWKARATGDNEFVMVQSEVGSNGPGCFVDQYTTDEIVQNLETITRNFGCNTT